MYRLKPVDAGLAAPAVCRQLDTSSPTFHKTRAEYVVMDVSMMDRLR
jgi:hypothetical protein